MSALGQKQTSAHVRVMSALPPKADMDYCGAAVVLIRRVCGEGITVWNFARIETVQEPTLALRRSMNESAPLTRERDLILSTLNQCGGSRVQVCKTLGIHREMLNKKLDQYAAPAC